ncbi:TetR/AcrR family transcriptional regulator [Egicoccus halophilus]|uniref:TetR family transcriptional regulator n=1 Tax=Egicoccus halophilus TaxID=1670830 RepID=A0A8J3A8I5_9ACTN|nr:TetR/AcrR family transcriptional regulator [Egicoccus halophilus]GGI04214.1 TetR family transcriptional regulator [Egicoccus halophilus]
MTSPPPATRRERNRTRTRRALVDAALELCASDGFEAVSVDRIADAAGVSPRTFFRYFPTKDEVLFADYEDEFDVWSIVTAAHVPGETVLDCIRRGTHQVAADYLARQEHWDRWFGVVAADPVLQRRFLAARARLQQRAAAAIGRMLGIDPSLDPRPTALAAAAMATTDAALRIWEASGRTRPRLEVVDEALDGLLELTPLLASPTRPPAPS